MYRTYLERLWPTTEPLNEDYGARVIAFASEYGYLTTDMSTNLAQVLSGGKGPPKSAMPPGEGWVAIEPLRIWGELAEELHHQSMLSDALNKEDINALKRCISIDKHTGKVSVAPVLKCFVRNLPERKVTKIASYPSKTYYVLARDILRDFLNASLKGRLSYIFDYELTGLGATLLGRFQAGDLKARLTLQLAEEAFGGIKSKQCLHCKKWFVATYRATETARKSHSKYCEDSCKDGYHNARRPTTRAGRRTREQPE